MRIVVIGGHFTPASALIDVLLQRRQDTDIIFIARKHTREGDSALSAEYTLARDKGLKFLAITTGRIYRKLTINAVRSILKIPVGLVQSFYYLVKYKPNLVCSFGSYVAVPVVFAAWVLRIPVITHEQTLVPGLANRFIALFAKTIALSFADSEKFYPHKNIVLTGNPLRPEIFKKTTNFILEKTDPVLYITGGNQGSHDLNNLIFSALDLLLNNFIVIHQTGNSSVYNDYQKAKEIKENLPHSLSKKYLIYKYVEPEIIGSVFDCSDLVISRAGINTLTELWVLGKKAIVFPITQIKHREQEYNAEFFEKSGYGIAMRLDRTNKEQFLENINSLISRQIDQEMKRKTEKLIIKNAADKLADLVLSELQSA